MAKGKFAPGSLDSIHSTIRDKKKSGAAAAKTPLARSREQLNTKDLSDSSSSSSSDSSDGSGSDSDVEAERQKLQAKLASKKKPVEPKLNGTKSAPAKPTPDATKSTPDSDSDSESVSTRASLNKTLSADRATKQKTADESESESTSDSGSESDSESEDQSSKKNAAQPSTKADASSSEESDTSETSSSEDEDEDEDSAAKNAASKDKNDKKKDSASPSGDIARVNGDEAVAESSTQVARPQWLNNSDFMLRKASSDNPGKEVADFFTNANLEGKQLWYFTAPASLPITVLKDMEIDLAKVTSGGPLLKHEGDDYGLDLEPYATSTQIQLLIPSHGGDKYTALNRGIDSTVHLRRIAKFGPGGEVGATASDEYIPQPKPIRQQPTGLKPRFTPIGVPNPKLPAATVSSQRGATTKISSENVSESSSTSDSGSDSDSDVEMTNAPEVPLSTPRATNGALKRKLASEEQPPPSSAAKGTKSDGKATKKPKPTTTAPTPSQLLSAKKETPVQPPNLSRIATAPTSTPSKPSTSKSKDKKDKKGSKDKFAKTLEGSETPVPPPSYLVKKSV
ncbi:DNA-directed RNA polymerase I subunit RPA34.5-domain-containing protein [Biscogniauxia mediterranea]|nr:DNA-directed RNA polymerase I subunit RPA34.5-domain-containing protein [Biscogniauxia mediterranea]